MQRVYVFVRLLTRLEHVTTATANEGACYCFISLSSTFVRCETAPFPIDLTWRQSVQVYAVTGIPDGFRAVLIRKHRSDIGVSGWRAWIRLRWFEQGTTPLGEPCRRGSTGASEVLGSELGGQTPAIVSPQHIQYSNCSLLQWSITGILKNALFWDVTPCGSCKN
jgi:hypothetical protein